MRLIKEINIYSNKSYNFHLQIFYIKNWQNLQLDLYAMQVLKVL